MTEREKDALPLRWVLTTLGAVQKDGSQSIIPQNHPRENFELDSTLVSGKIM